MIFLGSASIAQVASSPTDIAPLLIGEQLPDVELRSADNAKVNLLSVVSEKPTVLLFYRGGWCPYCNTHLMAIQEIEKNILDEGYQILAISPDSPENIKITGAEKDINYQLLSDADGTLIKSMGITFEAPERYSKRLFSKSDGLNDGFLPVPSVFIADQSGKIVFEYINPDYKTRLSGDLLMAVLENL